MSGPVKFKGSVVYKGEFLEIEAKINGSRIKNNGEIPFKPFPVILIKIVLLIVNVLFIIIIP